MPTESPNLPASSEAPGEKVALVVTPARRPTRSAREFWDWCKRAYESFADINGTNWSAAFAYYAFFALVPLVLSRQLPVASP